LSPAVARSPIDSRKSGTLDLADNYERKLVTFRDSCIAQATDNLRANPEYARIGEYIDLIEGRHWNTPDLARTPSYRSRFVDNRIASSRMDKLSELTDIKPIIQVETDVEDWEDQAKMNNRVIEYEWGHLGLDKKLTDVVDHGLFTTGFWKIDSGTPGWMGVDACGLDNLLPVEPDIPLQQNPAVVFRTYYTLPHLMNKWPHKARAIEREAAASQGTTMDFTSRPWQSPQSQWGSMTQRTRQRAGSGMPQKTRAYPLVQVTNLWVDDFSINETDKVMLVKDPMVDQERHNYWYHVAPGQRIYPRKRLIVFAGNTPLWDGPNPYWHGLYPFVQLILRPNVWRPGGISMYRDLVPLNRAVNKIGAGTMENIEQCLNRTLTVRGGAVNDGDWQRFFPDMPGAKLKMTGQANANDIKWNDPPMLPQYVFSFLGQYLLQSMDRHAGTVDVASLGRKNQVPGGDTIEQMRDSLQTPLRLEMRQIEAFLREAGTQAISHIFQNYTLKRRMTLFGPDGITSEDFLYDPGVMTPYHDPKESHHKHFTLRIAPGSMHGASKDRNKQLAIVLFKIGATSRQDLLRHLEWGTPAAQIEQELQEQFTPDAVGKGRTPRLVPSERVGTY
jgi:hypothetical protein